MSAITLQQAKDWLRIDFDDDDEIIQELIDTAESWIETYTCHVLSERDYTIDGDGCAHDVYLYPISGIDTDIKYHKFTLYSSFNIPKGKSTTFKVGYANYNSIPKQLITACKKLITYNYENRDVYSVELPYDVQILVNQLRRNIAFA